MRARRIRTVVVDDEPLARSGIIDMLAHDSEVEVVGAFADGASAVEGIAALRPDLLFLDVQMPELNGFEVLALLDTDVLPAVVFVTAFDQFAVRAFEVNAFDYVLKPLSDDRLRATLDRAKQRLGDEAERGLATRLVQLLESQKLMRTEHTEESTRSGVERLIVREAGRVRFVPLVDVDWIEGADYYTKVHADGATLMLRESLTSLELRLDPRRFFRLHRSSIVNVDRIRELRVDDGSAFIVVLRDGTRLKLGRGRRASLEALLAQTSARD